MIQQEIESGDTRDVLSISGSGRSPGKGNGHLVQYSCLRNPMDREACFVHGVTKTEVTEHTHILFLQVAESSKLLK